MINPGKMRVTISVEQNTPTRDEMGGEEDHWSTVATRRAQRLKYNPRGERMVAHQRTAESTHVFLLRYDSVLATVTEDMRVLFDGDYLDIIDIDDQFDRHREMILFCEKST